MAAPPPPHVPRGLPGHPGPAPPPPPAGVGRQRTDDSTVPLPFPPTAKASRGGYVLISKKFVNTIILLKNLRFFFCVNPWISFLYWWPGQPLRGQPAANQVPKPRAAKTTTSNNLQVKNFYAIPLAEKYKTLQAIDGEEFSNRVLGALNNEDVTETCFPFSWD